MLGRVIFAINEKEAPEFEQQMALVLERQLSYFADWDSLEAMLEYLGEENPWSTVLKILCSGFGEENPREPFALWKEPELTADFKDFIAGLMSFDPAKRLTAKEALEHSWLQT